MLNFVHPIFQERERERSGFYDYGQGVYVGGDMEVPVDHPELVSKRNPHGSRYVADVIRRVDRSKSKESHGA